MRIIYDISNTKLLRIRLVRDVNFTVHCKVKREVF